MKIFTKFLVFLFYVGLLLHIVSIWTIKHFGGFVFLTDITQHRSPLFSTVGKEDENLFLYYLYIYLQRRTDP